MKKLMLLAAVILVAVTSASAQFKFTSIDVPKAKATRIYGINDNGLVVGYFWDSGGLRHGFLLKQGSFTTIDVPGATETMAFGINNAGDIVGFYNSGGARYGFLFSKGGFTTFSFPGAADTTLFGINNKGDIVGFYSYDLASYQGFLYHRGTYTDVIAPGGTFTGEIFSIGINDAGTIVGNIVDPTSGANMGFSENKDQYFTFIVQAAPNFNIAAGINRNGDIVGSYAYAAFQSHGYLLSHGIATTIDFPGAMGTRVSAINSYDNMVGFYITSDGTNHGLLIYPLTQNSQN